MATAEHRFVWYDLATTEFAAAADFYGRVLGWTTRAHDDDYTLWVSGERMVGGMTLLDEAAKQMGTPPHWLQYVGVVDLDAAVAKATELGATVLVPVTAIGANGRFAVLADPTGGVFALYPSEEDLGEQPVAGVGHPSWSELYTGDLEAATEFYVGMFGWKTEDVDMGGGIYRLFANPDMGRRHMGGMCALPPGMPPHPAWLMYVTVDDLEAALARVREGGGQVLNGPMSVGGADRVAQCVDPQGAAFALHTSG